MKTSTISQLTEKEQQIMSLLGASYATRSQNDDSIYLWRDKPTYIAQLKKFTYGKSRQIAAVSASLFPSVECDHMVTKEDD